MKHGTLYHIPSGAIVGTVSGPDGMDFAGYADAAVGVIDGAHDRKTLYVQNGAVAPRVDVSVSAPASVTLGQPVTLTGLPDPCWLNVEGAFHQVTGGTVTRTPAIAREFTVELIGAHRASVTVTVKAAEQTALDADARWQALQTATPQQVEDWLTANVTTLASARQVLKLLLLAVRKLGA